MTILLTNDDGFTSPGVTLLAASLRKSGHRVLMAAPDKNRSGASHSIEFLSNPIKLTKIDTDSWSCSGTPVDCIIVSLYGGLFEIDINKNAPDVILSGINIGANLGTDITYSGTASAARQGSFAGIPSIALSLVENKGEWNWEPAISYITENLETFISYWKKGSFVNINFPNNKEKPRALVNVFPSIRYYNDKIVPYTAPGGAPLGVTYCFAEFGVVENEPAEGSDWAEVRKGNAALSVISSQPVIL